MVNSENVFEALADNHRRELLVELLSSPQHVAELSELSREIAAADEDLLHSHLSSSRTIAGTDKYLIGMRHVHLPKLAEYEFVEWNDTINFVSQGAQFDDIKPYLELLTEEQSGRDSKGPVVTYRR